MVALLPILAGIGTALRLPALVSSIFAVAVSVFGWFLTWFTKRTAMNLTIIALVSALALVNLLALKGILSGLSYVLPPGISEGFAMVIPSNAPACLSAVFSARVIRWVWEWKAWAIAWMSHV
ncbi:DUF5455 family protein [Photobacterium indicum]|uniref:DUF5455 family protein n=1 Tax=Photobacterium indicum TaxID=81447 RepID=UPI003D10F727